MEQASAPLEERIAIREDKVRRLLKDTGALPKCFDEVLVAADHLDDAAMSGFAADMTNVEVEEWFSNLHQAWGR